MEEQFEGFMDILTDHCGLEEPGGDYDSGITGEDEEGEEENVEESVEDVVLMNDFAEGTSVSTKSMNRAARRAKAVEDEEMPDDMAAEDMNNDYDDELNFGLGSTKLGTGPTTELGICFSPYRLSVLLFLPLLLLLLLCSHHSS